MSKKKPIKKMTLRGCQTALGIARRKMRDAEARHETRYQLALDNIRHLRQALGEPYPGFGIRDYKQFNVDIALYRREFSRARVALRKGMEEKDPAFAAVRQDALVMLNNAYSFISAAEPFCVCRMCQGQGCKACGNRGWQTEDQYKRNPKEFQA